MPSRVYYMRVNHGRADVFVVQALLGLADVVAHLRMQSALFDTVMGSQFLALWLYPARFNNS